MHLDFALLSLLLKLSLGAAYFIFFVYVVESLFRPTGGYHSRILGGNAV